MNRASPVGSKRTGDSPFLYPRDVSFNFINEQFFASEVNPKVTDELLARGWRHFGEHFFRYNLGIHGDEIRIVHALRINLSEFRPSRGQRRILSRNSDTSTSIATAAISDEIHELFHRHKQRFTFGVPESIFDFVSTEPARIPCETLACTIREDQRLLAVSFFEAGNESISSIYAMFEPSETRRGLGILTMLREIEFAIRTGKKYYYHGYIYEGNSFYDYKKRFNGLEIYDWNRSWTKFEDR